MFKGHASKSCNTGVCHCPSLIVHKVGLNGLIYIFSYCLPFSTKQKAARCKTQICTKTGQTTHLSTANNNYTNLWSVIIFILDFKTPVSHADYKMAVMALLHLILSLRYLFAWFYPLWNKMRSLAESLLLFCCFYSAICKAWLIWFPCNADDIYKL